MASTIACLSTVNVSNFVSAKLSGDKKLNNYRTWKQQMLCLIESQDLLLFINGKLPVVVPKADGGEDDDDINRRTDKLLMGWILGSLADSVLKIVVNLTTSSARDVWLELEKMFTAPLDQQEKTAPKEWDEYLPLYRAALAGDWNTAKEIFDQDPNATKATIGFTLETALHIAVGTGKAIHFVENLVNLMSDELLGIKEEFGFTALHVAALAGNTAAAQILVGRCPDLLYVTDNDGRFPVHMAALSAHRETLWYLISQTKDDHHLLPSPYVGQSGVRLILNVIDSSILDVALHLARKYPDMARSRFDEKGDTALRRITLKATAFSSGTRRSNFLDGFIYSLPHIKAIRDKKHTNQQAVDLVKCLCKNMESLDYTSASSIYHGVVLTAARLGVHEVIEVVVATWPAAIYSRNPLKKQYLFHSAVENRSEKVFNLIHQASDLKHQYVDKVDISGNTLLHLAARLAPHHKLTLVSGAALQMQREIQWFKEVEKIVHPYSRERPNKNGKTPKMIFIEEHMSLKTEGEKWMKDTANSCTIAAALIATVVFAAAITVPGGNQSNGFPLFTGKSAFIIFAISDATSLFTSITSLLMFLSILTSRYAEEDFLYALPKRLCIGLVTLFISISFMMLAFSATLYLVFGQKKAWILIPVAALACLPVTSFVLLQSPLLVDVISSTYGRGIFRKQSNRPFY